MTTPAIETLDLSIKFPAAVTADVRPGFSGWVVDAAKLIEVIKKVVR